MTIEEKKEMVCIHLGLLKKFLNDSDLVIGFDKESDTLIFIDRTKYIEEREMCGFKIPFSELEN